MVFHMPYIVDYLEIDIKAEQVHGLKFPSRDTFLLRVSTSNFFLFFECATCKFLCTDQNSTPNFRRIFTLIVKKLVTLCYRKSSL